MGFTVGLLEQLLEDMSSISNEFEQNHTFDNFNGDLDKILAFIRYDYLLLQVCENLNDFGCLYV